MDYKLMAARKDPDWDMLHERYAPLVLDLTLQLRGLYVKLGQQASTMTIVPPQYRAKLQMLQKGVPPKPLEEVRAIIERSFEFRNEEKRWGWHVTSLERWTLRWLSTTRLRTQLIFRAYDTRRPLALTSCNPFPLRSPVACTPTHPHPSSASHNLQHGRTSSRSRARATSTARLHATCHVRARLTRR